MTVNTINYTVEANGVTPAVIKSGGVQGDHNVTKLVFSLPQSFVDVLFSSIPEGEKLYYRFDGYSGANVMRSTEAIELTKSGANGVELSYFLENWITKDGGNVVVNLVLVHINTDVETESELYCFPVSLALKARSGRAAYNEAYKGVTGAELAAKEAARRAGIYEQGAISAMDQSGEYARKSEGQAVAAKKSADSAAEKLEEFKNFQKLSTDQTYNPTSTNAQSGVAVAEAVETAKRPRLFVGTELNMTDEVGDNGETVIGTYLAKGNEQLVNARTGDMFFNIENNFYYEITDASPHLSGRHIIYEIIGDINAGGGGVVDQAYDPTSPNAQSGTAVAEAVGTKMDKGHYVSIDYADSIIQNSTASVTSNNIYNSAGDYLAIIPCMPGYKFRLDYSTAISVGTVDCFIKNAAGVNILTIYDDATYTSKEEVVVDFTVPTDGVSIVIHCRWNSPIPKLYMWEDIITSFNKQMVDIKDDLQSVKNDVESLTGSSIVIERNSKAISQINSASCYGYNAKGSFNVDKRFTALVTTDVHLASKQLKNAVEFINGVDAIDCGICLGDIQGSNYHDNDGTWYTDIVNTSTKPFYTVLGNHDLTFNSASGLTPCGTPSEAFARFIQPTLDVVGENITLPYYAITNNAYKTVLICLNNYDAPTTLNSSGTDFVVKRHTEALSQGQIDWLINALSNIPNDYHLIIARHSYPIANELIGNEWSQTVRNKVDTADGDKISAVLVGSDTAYNEDVVSDIVNAWKNKNNFSKTYTPKSTYSVCPTLNVIANFSTRTESNFVCYLVGHAHYDAVCKSSLYNDQLIIGLCATADGEWQNEASDLPRIKNTKSEDAITTVSVDTINRKIYLVRIGSDITFDLKKRDYTVIGY